MRDYYRDLKVVMFQRGVTQQELAGAIGVSEPTLNAKLNGRSDFTVSEAKEIIEYLDIAELGTSIFLK